MGKRKRKPEKLTDQLRRAILDDGRPQRQIALAAGVDRCYLNRFLRRGGRLSSEAIDRLCEALRLELVKQDE